MAHGAQQSALHHSNNHNQIKHAYKVTCFGKWHTRDGQHGSVCSVDLLFWMSGSGSEGVVFESFGSLRCAWKWHWQKHPILLCRWSLGAMGQFNPITDVVNVPTPQLLVVRTNQVWDRAQSFNHSSGTQRGPSRMLQAHTDWPTAQRHSLLWLCGLWYLLLLPCCCRTHASTPGLSKFRWVCR